MTTNSQTQDSGGGWGLSTFGEAALAYARRGWAVFPLAPRTKDRPLVLHGCLDASKEPGVITRWWHAHPQGNIGIATGRASGLLVLDVDFPKSGGESLVELESRWGRLPVTPTSLTGSGGEHYYLALPPGVEIRNSASKLGPGLDIRGEAGYVVAPPSIHPLTLAPYLWEITAGPEDISLAEAPGWLLELLRSPRPPSAQPGNSPGGAWRLLLETIPQGNRNDSLARLGGWLRLYHPHQVVLAILQVVNRGQCLPPLDEDEVKSIAASVMRYPQPGVNGHPRAVVPSFKREAFNG